MPITIIHNDRLTINFCFGVEYDIVIQIDCGYADGVIAARVEVKAYFRCPRVCGEIKNQLMTELLLIPTQASDVHL